MTRILIAEDSPTQAEKLRWILQSEGFEVDAAVDAQDGLAQFALRTPDLVISDIVMPGMTGYEFCHHIKKDPRGKNVPVVLLSTLNDPMDIIRGLECEADNFITKPYEPEQLVSRIRTVLGNREIRKNDKLKLGVEIVFLGQKFVIDSAKEQILDLLIATFEDIVRTNGDLKRSKAELSASKTKIEVYAQELERRVQERTKELRTAELAARRDQKRFQDLFDFAPDAIVMTSTEGLITLVNRQAEQLFGYAREELLGQAVETLMPDSGQMQHRQLRQRFLGAAMPRTMGGGQHGLRALKKDGTIFPVEISLAPMVSEEGMLVAAAVRDISAREKLEAEHRQLQKLEAIGKLTGGLAHDFNNYLGVIIGNLDLLQECGVNDPRAKAYIDTAVTGALRGAELTKSLLAFARRQPLSPKVIDIRNSVSAIARLIERTLGGDIVVKVELAPEVWPVRIDEAMLNTSIVNLANNARDAMQHGGRLTLAVRNVELDETYARMNPDVNAGDFVLIEVSDTGNGMTPETLADAFEPFYTTKGEGHGTGLGLSAVHGFVKQSNGNIKIYSEVGHGTTVRIYLPRVTRVTDEDAAASAASVDPVMSPSGTETILVVDDSQPVRQTAAQQLGALGYRVLEAENGEAAVDILSRGEPAIDLLFTDIIMPGKLDGYALAGIAVEQRPGIRVLLTSGFPGTQSNGNDKHTPDQKLLTKPYRKDDLARAIRATLDAELPSTPV